MVSIWKIGGRDFDKVLLDYFQKDFLARYKLDAYSNTRARLRLRNECEKLKKLMSSNSSPIPLNIECFMNDVDVQGRMNRADFEKMSESLFTRIRKCMTQLLAETSKYLFTFIPVYTIEWSKSYVKMINLR